MKSLKFFLIQKMFKDLQETDTNEIFASGGDSPGSCAGKAMMGHETRMDSAPDSRKPIHQPPSHRSLFASRPKLRKNDGDARKCCD